MASPNSDDDVKRAAERTLPEAIRRTVLEEHSLRRTIPEEPSSSRPCSRKRIVQDEVFARPATFPPRKIKKRIIFADLVSKQGFTWILKETGVFIKFLPEAVTDPRLITCMLWKPGEGSPPLEDNESLVSNVIELDCDDSNDLVFSSIEVALTHSAKCSGGYELVMKEMTDTDGWRDLETLEVQPSDLLDEHSGWQSKLPLVRGKITSFSRYAVIYRLKTFRFQKETSTRCHKFECSVPDFPGVSVSIPETSLPSEPDFMCTIKVEEVSIGNFQGSGVLIGPILHMLCNSSEEVKGRVSLSIPLAPHQKQIDYEEMPIGPTRVFSRGGRDKLWEWTDITNELYEPPRLKNGIVNFQLNGIKKSQINQKIQYWTKVNFSRERVNGRERFVDDSFKPQEVGFLAFLCNQRHLEIKKLILCCFPIHMKSELKRDISSNFEVFRQGEGNSCKPLSAGDLVYFSVSDGLTPVDTRQDPNNTPLRFLGEKNCEREILVCCQMTGVTLDVTFYKLKNAPEEKESLSTLSLLQTQVLKDQFQDCESSPPPRKPEVDLAIKEELREKDFTFERSLSIAADAGTCWLELGTKLKIPEGELRNIGTDHPFAKPKGFAVLQSWRDKNGHDATIGRLLDALESIGKKRIADLLFDIELQEKFKDQTETSQKLEEQCERLIAEISKAQNIERGLRSVNQKYESYMASLWSENKKHENDVARLRWEIKNGKSNEASLRLEIQSRKNHEESLMSEIQNYKNGAASLRSEIQHYKNEEASLRSEIEIYKDLIDTLCDELSRTRSLLESQST